MTDPIKDEPVEQKNVVEQRIKPTVIRRRAKKVEEPVVEETAVSAEPVSSETKAPSLETPKEAPKQAIEAPSFQEQTEAKQVSQDISDLQKDGAPRPKLVGQLDLAELERRNRASTGRGSHKKAVVEAPPAPRIGVVGHIEKIAPELSEELKERLKVPKRKKSKAELEQEDIEKAGGLHQFADELLSVEAPTVSDRVFEPARRKKPVRREFLKTKITQPKAIKKVIRIEEKMTVSALSQSLGVKASDILKKLIELGVETNINSTIDFDTVGLIADEHGFKTERVGLREEELLAEPEASASANLKPRPPVVTVMGHVDHGKTSILDYIRKAKVAEGEAGGITQHIGAYEVELKNKKITFIDTPGHEAFTMMRARGAMATDIVILVVAADDGPMPQTVEAINHAKAAEVPIIVAINKSDLPGANPDKVKQLISEKGLVPEDWGGDTIFVPTSAKTGSGIDNLLEMISIQAEMLELKADPEMRPKGVVLEGKLEKGRGPVATVLVQEGTLKRGSFVVCGTVCGKIRAMVNAQGKQINEAPPSTPVEIQGLDGVPNAGDEMVGVVDDKTARVIAEQRIFKLREQSLQGPAKLSLEDLTSQDSEELRILLKGDVAGSVEAIKESFEKIPSEKVKISVIHRSVGMINESDVMLASASKSIIIGFNVTADKTAVETAKREGVEIRIYRIIYELLDDIRKAMIGLLEPLKIETATGTIEVKEVYKMGKVGTVAGCIVTSGKVSRKSKIRLSRDGKIVYEGSLASLKRFKDDAREVVEGQECGMSFEKYQDGKPGDIVEAYDVEEKEATL